MKSYLPFVLSGAVLLAPMVQPVQAAPAAKKIRSNFFYIFPPRRTGLG